MILFDETSNDQLTPLLTSLLDNSNTSGYFSEYWSQSPVSPPATATTNELSTSAPLPQAPMSPISPPSSSDSNKPIPAKRGPNGKFGCTVCGKQYTHNKHLRRHMMRHTGQKPYNCRYCPSRYSRPDIRKRHEDKCKLKCNGVPMKHQHQPQVKVAQPDYSSDQSPLPQQQQHIASPLSPISPVQQPVTMSTEVTFDSIFDNYTLNTDIAGFNLSTATTTTNYTTANNDNHHLNTDFYF